MKAPAEIRTIIMTGKLHDYFAVYMHIDLENTVRYVGITPLPELFTFEDARRNTEWEKVFQGHNVQVDVRVQLLTTDVNEANQEMKRLIKQFNPDCNRNGFQLAPANQNVYCNETGETFHNAAAAAAAHGLSTSALYNHLNGKKSWNTVKGKTYKRITPDIPSRRR